MARRKSKTPSNRKKKQKKEETPVYHDIRWEVTDTKEDPLPEIEVGV